jgi:hypothetical protein
MLQDLFIKIIDFVGFFFQNMASFLFKIRLSFSKFDFDFQNETSFSSKSGFAVKFNRLFVYLHFTGEFEAF